MKTHLFFVKCLAVLGFVSYGFNVHSSNQTVELETFYTAVECADVETVEKMLMINPKLKTVFYKDKSPLYPLLRATRLKNKVQKIKLKKYAKIITLFGADTAAMVVRKGKEWCGKKVTPLLYSQQRCYPIIDKELINFEPKPQTYKPKTKEESLLRNAKSTLLAEDVALFLTKKILQMDFAFKNKGVVLSQEAVFTSDLKDLKGRSLSGVFVGQIAPEGGIEEFHFKLYAQNVFLAEIIANVNWIKNESMDVFIVELKVSEGERQNGVGRLLLKSLIKACAQLEKLVFIELYAVPIGFDSIDERKKFSPLLVHFYKMQGFVPDKYSECTLKLTIENGSVVPGYKLKNK